MSKLAYKTADRLTAMANSADRANRGVRLEGWMIATGFSAAVWAVAFFLVKVAF